MSADSKHLEGRCFMISQYVHFMKSRKFENLEKSRNITKSFLFNEMKPETRFRSNEYLTYDNMLKFHELSINSYYNIMC